MFERKNLSCPIITFYAVFIVFAVISINCKKEKPVKPEDAGREESDIKRKVIVTVPRLNVRQGPSLKSKIIGVALKCESLEVLGASKNYITVKNTSAPMLKVRREDGAIGYVYSTYVRKEDSWYDTLKKNKKPFDIKGMWSKYMDPPNEAYVFLCGGKLIIEIAEDYEKPVKYVKGAYSYDGCCKITISDKDGTKRTLDVVTVDGEPTLRQGCFVFNPELHSDDEKTISFYKKILEEEKK